MLQQKFVYAKHKVGLLMHKQTDKCNKISHELTETLFFGRNYMQSVSFSLSSPISNSSHTSTREYTVQWIHWSWAYPCLMVIMRWRSCPSSRAHARWKGGSGGYAALGPGSVAGTQRGARNCFGKWLNKRSSKNFVDEWTFFLKKVSELFEKCLPRARLGSTPMPSSPNRSPLGTTISLLTSIIFMLLLSAIIFTQTTNKLQHSYYCCVSRFYGKN